MRKLPNYIDDLGHGSCSHAVPVTLHDCISYGFALAADCSALQRFVDSQLNRAASRKFRYRALPLVLHCYLNCPKGTNVENVGWIPDREAAFLVPVVEFRRGALPRLKVWAPYMFIDQPGALITGRDVWGYRKALGFLDVPEDPQQAQEFSVITQVFEKFNPNCPARNVELLKLTRSAAATADNSWSDTAGARQQLLQRIADALGGQLTEARGDGWIGRAMRLATRVGAGVGDRMGLGLASLLDRLLGGIPDTMTAINLKQLRDAEDSTKACYQALVDSPCKVDLDSGGFLGGSYELEIPHCDSHPLVKDLGLRPLASGSPARVPTLFGFWARMKFSGLNGKVIWESR
ncbi:MAG TPA: hypothetical protein VLI06_10895 [Solimonas sp.]|nr:hypothetical protein [Solimonas sp.]